MDAGRKPAFLPVCESLEDRTLLASRLTANLSGGLLRIDGTSLADRILVRQIYDRISVAGAAIAVNGQHQASVSAASVQRIEVRSYGGDDVIGFNSEVFRGQQPIRKAATVWAGSGDDSVWGGWGIDTAYGEDGTDRLLGSEGNDSLLGGNGNDRLDGGHGNDSLDGGYGNDVLLGRSGNDNLKGGPGNDTLSGSYGNDRLDGGTGTNQMSGGAGRDAFFSHSVYDRIDGGADFDVARFLYGSPPRSTAGGTAVVSIEQFVNPSSSSTAAAPAPTVAKPFQADVTRLLYLTNAYRVQNGLKALPVDSRLAAAAQYQADYMARTGAYSHVNLDGRDLGDRVLAAGYHFNWAGENIHLYDPAIARTYGIARTYSLAELPNYFFDGWRVSPGHNANMLTTQALQIGIAMARSSTGLIYAVQVFGR